MSKKDVCEKELLEALNGISLSPTIKNIPECADPEGSIRYENVTIVHILVPCKEAGVIHQWFKENNTFVIYECVTNFKSVEMMAKAFTGTILKEADGKYSWWRTK